MGRSADRDGCRQLHCGCNFSGRRIEERQSYPGDHYQDPNNRNDDQEPTDANQQFGKTVALHIEMSDKCIEPHGVVGESCDCGKHTEVTRVVAHMAGNAAELTRKSARPAHEMPTRSPRIVLLAEDERGYVSLCEAISTAQLRGRKRDARLRLRDLEGKTQGLVALSGGPNTVRRMPGRLG